MRVFVTVRESSAQLVLSLPRARARANVLPELDFKDHIDVALGEHSPELVAELRGQVRKAIGGIAMPDMIVVVPGLPKTRSGKIMRRVLRKVAAGEEDSIGDTSTLADPDCVGPLVALVKAAQKK